MEEAGFFIQQILPRLSCIPGIVQGSGCYKECLAQQGRVWEVLVQSREKEKHRSEMNGGSGHWAAVMTSWAALCLDHRGVRLNQDRPLGVVLTSEHPVAAPSSRQGADKENRQRPHSWSCPLSLSSSVGAVPGAPTGVPA